MFITPYFGGCKYTNNFLFINKNIEIQHLDMLITFSRHRNPQQSGRQNRNKARFPGKAEEFYISFCIFGSWGRKTHSE